MSNTDTHPKITLMGEVDYIARLDAYFAEHADTAAGADWQHAKNVLMDREEQLRRAVQAHDADVTEIKALKGFIAGLVYQMTSRIKSPPVLCPNCNNPVSPERSRCKVCGHRLKAN